MINSKVFFDSAKAILDEVHSSQKDNVQKAADIISESIKNGGITHIFGTGHSLAFAMELNFRAGGLVPFHGIRLDDLVTRGLYTYPELRDPIFERRTDIVKPLLGLYDIRKEDVFILVSNSGINGTIVELACEVKANGHKLIVVTSMQHSSKETSRHPSGKKLYEIADLVIDNCAPFGDALLDAKDGMKVCSISSITGNVIAQMLTAAIYNNLTSEGIECPVLMSANVKGADEYNKKIVAPYEGRYNS